MNTSSINDFKQKALTWANNFDVCCYFDSNHYHDEYGHFDCIIAAGVEKKISLNAGNAFHELKAFYEEHKTWLFGFLSYDLKNETESLTSLHTDHLGFPDLFFFIPQYIIGIHKEEVKILKGNLDLIDTITQEKISKRNTADSVDIKSRLTQQQYIEKVNLLKQHILRGDIYEVNFCQEFYADNILIDPLVTYQELNAVSPTPFSGYFKVYNRYIISATPERFIGKRKNKLISQPIKGTAKRQNNEELDLKIKTDLKNNPKEQAENVMIVDLVRNDLTKSAKKGTVKVEELFGIYSFPQVHQMISTISCELDENIHFIDALKNAFPMGSMTGAPKLRAMELIEEYEESKRGIYSGSFGLITPDGDFDFNVVIRTILYNALDHYLSFQVGGAITYQCTAENEYEECLLKASAMIKVLKGRLV